MGNNLRKIRNEKGFSIEVLAKRSGASKNMIYCIERNESEPTIEMAKKIASGLGVTVGDLFDLSLPAQTRKKVKVRKRHLKHGEYLKDHKVYIDRRIVVAANLKEARKRAGMTQEELAKLVGIRQVSVTNYENGKRMPRGLVREKLAEAFGTTVEELFCLESEPREENDAERI